MEIILALMVLGATPFGAALLDKPTRNRFVKFAKAHTANSILSRDGHGRLTMAEALKLEPRNKDWGADTALQSLWQEAFDYWSIRDREQTFKSALGKYMDFVAETDGLRQSIKEYEDMRHDSYSGGYYRLCTERITGLEEQLDARLAEYKTTLSDDEQVAIRLHKKYGKEVYYKNDLVRITSQKALPSIDFLALTSYASTK